MQYKIHISSESNRLFPTENKFSSSLLGAKQIARRAVNVWAAEATVYRLIGHDIFGEPGYDEILTIR